MRLSSKIMRMGSLMTLTIASAAMANNGRYDRGYTNDGLSQTCVVIQAYRQLIPNLGGTAIQSCLHPD